MTMKRERYVISPAGSLDELLEWLNDHAGPKQAFDGVSHILDWQLLPSPYHPSPVEATYVVVARLHIAVGMEMERPGMRTRGLVPYTSSQEQERTLS